MGKRDPFGIRGEQAGSLRVRHRSWLPRSVIDEARGGARKQKEKKKKGTGEDRSPGFAASDGHKTGLSSWKTERDCHRTILIWIEP